MKNFKVLVEYPAFATYEIVANSAEEAIAKAKALDEGDDPEDVLIDFDAKAKFSIVK